MHHIAIFASGTGTNAENIIRHFKNSEKARVALLVCNDDTAPVVARAKNLLIDVCIVSRGDLINTERLQKILEVHSISFIVLAGFLKLIPAEIIRQYQNRIINIHPALLPRFGGKGMYGRFVHEAVISSGEKESGITIHYVNAHFDEGEIIFQKKISVDKNETPKSLAGKIHTLEYEFYPEVILSLLQ